MSDRPTWIGVTPTGSARHIGLKGVGARACVQVSTITHLFDREKSGTRIYLTSGSTQAGWPHHLDVAESMETLLGYLGVEQTVAGNPPVDTPPEPVPVGDGAPMTLKWDPGVSMTNTGHGHVYVRPDGAKARCGGPALCRDCGSDLYRLLTGADK